MSRSSLKHIETSRIRLAGVHLVLVLLVLAGCAGLMWWYFGLFESEGISAVHRQGTDDAYISYRYARHLAEGHGLVFNVGERVEGYTNFLFVLGTSLLFRVAEPEQIYPLICIINIAFLFLSYVLLYRHVRRSYGVGPALLVVSAFGLVPGVWLWTASGMETILVLLLHMALWFQLERSLERASRDAIGLVLIMALCLLVRADGFVVVGIGLVYLVLNGHGRLALKVAVPVVAVGLVYVSWRWFYYGDLLPNTYYAKVHSTLWNRLQSSLPRLYRLSMQQGFWPHLLLMVGVLVSAMATRRRPWPFAAFFPVVFLGYWLAVGGDHFGVRMLLILFPMGVVLALRVSTRFPRGYVLLLLVLVGFQVRPMLRGPVYAFSWDGYDTWVTLGRYLKDRFPGRVLATGAAGKIPYYSELRTIDMHGLNDRHIARLEPRAFTNPGHDKIDPDYVLAYRPDLVTGWVQPSFDLNLGLNRDRYRAAGYRLALLVQIADRGMAEPIIEIRDQTEAQVRSLIADGYRFAVLVRTDE